MGTIEIDGRIFNYRTRWEVSEYGDIPITDFWSEEMEVTQRKYFLFGKKIIKKVPKIAFTIYEDSKNLQLSKGAWRAIIRSKLELLNRAEELEKGELI